MPPRRARRVLPATQESSNRNHFVGFRSGTQRVDRFAAGHHQRVSLSPLSAISDMLAPVVLIPLATILGNGLVTAGTNITDRISALNLERLGILCGPRAPRLARSWRVAAADPFVRLAT